MYSLVNLGSDRFFTQLINNYNLDNFNVELPFDKSTQSYSTVCKLIETDFQDYLSDITYNDGCFYNSKLDISWNNESTEDVDVFKDRYTTIVKQFLDILNKDVKILFTIHDNVLEFKYRPDELIRVLGIKYPKLDYKVFIYNNINHGFSKCPSNKVFSVNIYYMSSSFTDEDYTNINKRNTIFMNEIFSDTESSKNTINDILTDIEEVKRREDPL
tara:strand:- start:83 stop:727 length:645 start_codon:yes stop_codon:yes gene_type:complete